MYLCVLLCMNRNVLNSVNHIVQYNSLAYIKRHIYKCESVNTDCDVRFNYLNRHTTSVSRWPVKNEFEQLFLTTADLFVLSTRCSLVVEGYVFILIVHSE